MDVEVAEYKRFTNEGVSKFEKVRKLTEKCCVLLLIFLVWRGSIDTQKVKGIDISGQCDVCAFE